MPTFRSRLVGSTVIVQPDPKSPICRTLRFLGNPSGFGYLTTDDPDDLKVLMGLVANPQAQVELEPDDVPATAIAAKVPTKPVDPAIARAAADAAVNSERDIDPKLVGLRNQLATLVQGSTPSGIPSDN